MSSTAATGCAPTATARGRCLLKTERVKVDVSVAASVPTRSRDNAARAGMPDLPFAFEIGPNVNFELAQFGRPRRARRPAACRCGAAVGVQRSPDLLGVTFSPHLNLDLRDVGGWNVGLLTGPLFADRRYHQHFYGVDARLRDAAAAGLSGARRLRRLAGAAAAVSRRFGNSGSARSCATTACAVAVFDDSPLVRARPSNSRRGGCRRLAGSSRPRTGRVDDRRLSASVADAAGASSRSAFSTCLLYAAAAAARRVSLAWNLVAWLLYPLMPQRAGTLLGRAVISRVYRLFWATAELFGHDAHRRRRARRCWATNRRPDHRGQPPDDARRAAAGRAPAARRLHHEGRR